MVARSFLQVAVAPVGTKAWMVGRRLEKDQMEVKI
jgi:hypothetical protein